MFLNKKMSLRTCTACMCAISAVLVLSACPDPNATENQNTTENQNATSNYKVNAPKSAQTMLSTADLTDDYLFSVDGLDSSSVTAAYITLDGTEYAWDADDATTKITLSSFRVANPVLGVGLADSAKVNYEVLPDTFDVAFHVSADKTYETKVSVSKVSNVEKDAVSYVPIYTWWDLQSAKNDLSNNYILENDIKFPEPGTYGFPDYGFVPIGRSSNPPYVKAFTGIFDGNNHAIENFFIDTTNNNWPATVGTGDIGLFGAINGDSSVKNVMLISPSITASGNNVGGIVGQIYQGNVIAAVRGGSITGRNEVGGLVGIGRDSVSVVIGYSTSKVSAHVDVSQDANTTYVRAGGLVGVGGTVIGYATGEVSVSITDTPNAHQATGGGLVGNPHGCGGTFVGYATNKVSSTTGHAHGFSPKTPETSSGYWDKTIHATSEEGIGVSATKNIVFANGVYKDSQGTANPDDDTALFDQEAFARAFDTTQGTSKTWPQLKTLINTNNTEYQFTLPQPTIQDIDENGAVKVKF